MSADVRLRQVLRGLTISAYAGAVIVEAICVTTTSSAATAESAGEIRAPQDPFAVAG